MFSLALHFSALSGTKGVRGLEKASSPSLLLATHM